MNVVRLPHRPLDEATRARLRASLTATPLSRDELRDAPLEELNQPGPLVAPPGTPLADQLQRVRAIVDALLGPGRVRLDDGLDVAIELLVELREVAS